MSDRLWFHSIDYRAGRRSPGRINRGFWLHGIPRLMPLCRLLGHRPVVDGVNYGRAEVPGRRSRWVCCDRCGARLAQPVDSDLEIGQPYTDPLPAPTPAAGTKEAAASLYGARGVLGGQVVVWGGHRGVSVQAKVGHAGSENTLAGHVHLGRLGALYLHTEGHGTWLQRRLNPTGYDSRVVGIDIAGGRFQWELWAKRNESSHDDPWWMRGSVRIDPRDIVLGPLRYSYEDVSGPVTAMVRMPQGDDHEVTLQLQRRTHGRARSRRTVDGWTCHWSARPGIPTERGGRGGIWGSGVDLNPHTDPARLDWVGEACAAIAAHLAKDRARNGYAPADPVTAP